MTIIYLICSPCDDSYYEGHPAREYDDGKMSEHAVAFTTYEAAKAYIDSKNCDPDEDPEGHYSLYITSVEVRV